MGTLAGRIESTKGRWEEECDTLMADVRKPVFVDNAVHFAKVDVHSLDGKHKVTIESENKNEYKLATEKAYQYVESGDSLLITHFETPGHSLKSDIWTPEGRNVTTKIVFSSLNPQKRLTTSTQSGTSDGLLLELRNMRKRTLTDLGFSPTPIYHDAFIRQGIRDGVIDPLTLNPPLSLHFGRTVDIGFRTTDLVLKMTSRMEDSATSVGIGETMNLTSAGTNRRKHSNVFLAHDFNSMNTITALNLISKYDNRSLNMNKYGNLQYIPASHQKVPSLLLEEKRRGSENTNPLNDEDNRVTIQGIPSTLNDDVIITMEDAESQQSKFNVNVREQIAPTIDVTVKTSEAARKVARKMLQINKLAKGAIDSRGHPDAWKFRPGDLVSYKGEILSIIDAKHDTQKNLSDFKFVHSSSGLSGILQLLSENSALNVATRMPEKTTQIRDYNFSFFNSLEVKVIPSILVRSVAEEKILLGQHAGRRSIGGAATISGSTTVSSIGLNKGVYINIEGDY